MALLMRRLLVDAQAKLRRMVEEHSSSLSSRINPEYPASTSGPFPTPTSQSPDTKLFNSTETVVSPNTQRLVDSAQNKPTATTDNTENILLNVDGKCTADINQSTCVKANVTESKRSKSLCNTSSVDSSEDSKNKKDVKKCRSNPIKFEICDADVNKCDNCDISETVMTVEDSVGPIIEKEVSEDQMLQHDPSKPGSSSQQATDVSPQSPQSAEGNREELTTFPFATNISTPSGAVRRLRLENERLQAEITRLRRLVVSGASSLLAEKRIPSENTSEDSGHLESLETELQLAKEAITALKYDKRRLKAEKFELLNQMKQLYATLEDKEKELRDFIRNYEQRLRENETSLQQLSTEREERERERWSLLRHARDEAERSLSLAAQLNAKELQLQQAQEHLQEARRQLASSGCVSDQESLISLPPRHSANGALTPNSGGLLSGHHGLGLLSGDRGSCSADSGVRVNSDRESGATSVGGNLSDSTADGTPTITVESNNVDIETASIISSIPPPHMYQSVSTPKDSSPTLSPLNANNFSRSIDTSMLSRSVEQLSSPLDSEPPNFGRRLKNPQHRTGGGRGGTWGSISRVFARSRHRNKTNSFQENESSYDPYRSWSPLTEEGYAEKLRLLREASSVPMERWRAPTVLAWLEVALGMPQYGPRCAENIKSGKIGGLHGQVLLELTDLELECGLGITHPMHRKKLRLAIEEHRNPALVRYPCIAQLGHTWVSSEWLPDLGLSQYSENFATNLVDARMLEHLSKKELEKFLSVTRKFHQASIVHGIHLLRIMKYDRQALAVRRHQSETVDADPLVWTNQRFIRWARNIDLGEYADNLKDSGVHGGLVVLEPSFNGDTMATALGIPTSKNIIRRHLTAELEALVLPARSTLEHYVRVRTKSRVPGGSLGRSFSRSCAGLVASPSDRSNSDSRRASLRGSLSRAFGLNKSKVEPKEEKYSPTSSSESSSVISRISPPPLPFRCSHSGGESPIYATPFKNHFYDDASNTQISNYGYHSNRENTNRVDIYRNFTGNVVRKKDKGKSSDNSYSSLSFNKGQHRRVKSIGDIEIITVHPV